VWFLPFPVSCSCRLLRQSQEFVEVVVDAGGFEVGSSFKKQRGAIELKQLLLDQPAHHVGCVRRVHAIAELALVAVAIDLYVTSMATAPIQRTSLIVTSPSGRIPFTRRCRGWACLASVGESAFSLS
jgi:hypothetical protein